MKRLPLPAVALFVLVFLVSQRECYTDECSTTKTVSRKASTVYHYSCGWWGWWSCTGTRYYITHSTIEVCCDGYTKIDGRCLREVLDTTPSSGGFTESCMRCICEQEGCEKEVGKCKYDVNGHACGPFQIHYNYWVDCYKPGSSWQECTKDMACSERCIKAYMEKYGKRCTGGREPTCQDYARIHNGGPRGCRRQSKLSKERNLQKYWAAVSSHGNC